MVQEIEIYSWCQKFCTISFLGWGACRGDLIKRPVQDHLKTMGNARQPGNVNKTLRFNGSQFHRSFYVSFTAVFSVLSMKHHDIYRNDQIFDVAKYNKSSKRALIRRLSQILWLTIHCKSLLSAMLCLTYHQMMFIRHVAAYRDDGLHSPSMGASRR